MANINSMYHSALFTVPFSMALKSGENIQWPSMSPVQFCPRIYTYFIDFLNLLSFPSSLYSSAVFKYVYIGSIIHINSKGVMTKCLLNIYCQRGLLDLIPLSEMVNQWLMITSVLSGTGKSTVCILNLVVARTASLKSKVRIL